MTIKKLAAVLMVGSLVFASGCFEVRLDAEDNGTTITLNAGSRFTVHLASNASTGFEWQLVELDADIVENTGQEYIAAQTPPGLVGAGGTEVWTFTALSAGTTTLRLEYRRPWEPTEQEPADSFEITVVVTAAKSVF